MKTTIVIFKNTNKQLLKLIFFHAVHCLNSHNVFFLIQTKCINFIKNYIVFNNKILMFNIVVMTCLLFLKCRKLWL